MLGNPDGRVSEDIGAVLVQVELIGLLETDIVVKVETSDGTGENYTCHINPLKEPESNECLYILYTECILFHSCGW